MKRTIQQFKQEILAKMIALASEKHMGQYDKAGNPYILHCLKVMHYTKSDDPITLASAVGHDLFEDTDVDGDYLRGYLAPVTQEEIDAVEDLIDTIERVTKKYDVANDDGSGYDEYKAAVKGKLRSIRVKMADLRHNTDVRRLKGISDKDIARMKRYHALHLELEAAKEKFM